MVPLREGGSLPAVVDTETGGTFVVKFRGAGQGPKALIAEALVASIGLAVGLPVPTPAIVDLEDDKLSFTYKETREPAPANA